MGCSCKHNQDNISHEEKRIATLRELFIKRMTVDSESQDNRRRDYNQAIFGLRADGSSYPMWNYIDIDMVLQCFDNAVQDLRRTWCDVEDCRRK